jgi:hypothetical protein
MDRCLEALETKMVEMSAKSDDKIDMLLKENSSLRYQSLVPSHDKMECLEQ